MTSKYSLCELLHTSSNGISLCAYSLTSLKFNLPSKAEVLSASISEKLRAYPIR